MAVFEYEGLDAKGKPAKGIVDGESPRAVRLKLKRHGIFATRVKEVGARDDASTSKAKPGRTLKLFESSAIGAGDLSLLTRQLATLINAGLPLVNALGSLIEQGDGEKHRRLLSQVREALTEGKSFNEALTGHPRAFPPYYRNMVAAGESSGTLPMVLERLADFLEASQAFRRKLQGALIYPALMSLVGAGILWYLLTSLVPRVTEVFSDIGQALPLPTRALLAVSGWLSAYGWMLIGALFVGLFALSRYRRTPAGRANVHSAILRVPVYGKLVRSVALSRFAKTLGTLVFSGVELLTALEICKPVMDNAVLEEALDEAREEVREGRGLGESLKATGEYPALICQMVSVGEESGQLDTMLLKASDVLESRVDSNVAALTSLLEPLMILVMGIAVGFVVISILLPIYEMSRFV